MWCAVPFIRTTDLQPTESMPYQTFRRHWIRLFMHRYLLTEVTRPRAGGTAHKLLTDLEVLDPGLHVWRFFESLGSLMRFAIMSNFPSEVLDTLL